MRRMFLRIANIIAKNNNNKAIITGESLGQVASQTIQSINVINNVSDLAILRPVITYDKEEIIKIAKFIDTYDTSILPFDDVCSMFVPKDPIIKPKLDIANKLEENIYWNELLEETTKNNIKTFVYKNGKFVEE